MKLNVFISGIVTKTLFTKKSAVNGIKHISSKINLCLNRPIGCFKDPNSGRSGSSRHRLSH